MVTAMEKTARLSVEVNESIKSQFKQLAKEKERSVHFLMKHALDEYLDRESEKKAMREAFYDSAEQAIIDYHETGLHVTHDDMSAWLDSLKSANTDIPMPACHK